MKTINKLIFYIYILVTLTPVLSSTYLEFGLVCLWTVTALFLKHTIEKDWKLIIVLWLCYAILLRAIGFSTAAWGNYGVYVLFYFPLFAFYLYRDLWNQKEKNIAIIYILTVVTVNLLYNIVFLIMNPSANQELNFSDMYAGTNLGNSGFTFMVMLVLIFCLYYAVHGYKPLILVTIAGFFYLVISSKTTAFLIFVIVAYFIIIDRVLQRVNKVQKTITMIVGTILLLLLYRVGLSLLAQTISNDYIVTRINALLVGDTSSAYLSRTSLASLSFNTFLKNPILGIGYVKADFSKVAYITTGIGHHSEFIDHLGRYGLVGAAFYIAIYVSYYKAFCKNAGSEEDKVAGKLIYLAFLIYSILNNSMDAMSGIIIFYLLSAVTDGQFMQRESEGMQEEFYNIQGEA